MAQSFVTEEILIREVVRRFCIPQGTYIPPHLVSVFHYVSYQLGLMVLREA